MIFVKNSRGGREVNMINTLSKIGWEGGVNLNLDNVFKYTVFLERPKKDYVVFEWSPTSYSHYWLLSKQTDEILGLCTYQQVF